MLTIRLEPAVGAPICLAPVPLVRLVGGSLSIGLQDRPLAKYEHDFWTYGVVSFASVAIYQPIRLKFESPGQAPLNYGPYEGIRLVRNELQVGEGVAKVLARLDTVGRMWWIDKSLTTMSNVLIMPALSPLPADQGSDPGGLKLSGCPPQI